MTFPELLDHTRRRLRKRWIWAGVLALWIPSSVPRLMTAHRLEHLDFWGMLYALVLPFLQFASLAWLAPWAWLWTGRPTDRPGAWRGIVQGLVLGALTLGLLLALDLVLTQAIEGHVQEITRKVGEGVVSMSVEIASPTLLSTLRKIGGSTLTVAVVFCVFGSITVALDQASLAREAAERREREAQWNLLRGQINPHVFFNAMTGLTELIRKDPRAAEEAALDLTELLRRLMAHGQRHLAPLMEERLLVQRYLAVEALRLGSRLRIEWRWDPAVDAVEAPPFLLQPLVENAIKHGISAAPEGGRLEIAGSLHAGTVTLAVRNEGRPFTERRPGGLGLVNLEARLQLAFGADGRLILAPEDGWTAARVIFPAPQELA